jgi:hypothetical protein
VVVAASPMALPKELQSAALLVMDSASALVSGLALELDSEAASELGRLRR